MRVVFAVVVLCVVGALSVTLDPTTQFSAFERQFNKHYSSAAERAARFSIFKANLERVEKLNKQNGSPAFGVTKFMDLSPEEFRSSYLMPPLDLEDLPEAPMFNVPPITTNIPVSFDWTNHTPAVVTPIKNQEQCGSCWAFSATEEVESLWALAGNTLVELAPQQIVDCDKGDSGCNGGWPYGAYAYLIQCGGQEPESDYPYTGVNGKCTFNSADIAASISGWKYVSKAAGDENSTMLPFVYTTAPLSVCVDASTWSYYNGGVLKTCGDSIDHCVQITGFDTIDDTPVWVVRNSWGTDWGVGGFIYVPRNKNMCAIAQVATTVTAKSK